MKERKIIAKYKTLMEKNMEAACQLFDGYFAVDYPFLIEREDTLLQKLMKKAK